MLPYYVDDDFSWPRYTTNKLRRREVPSVVFANQAWLPQSVNNEAEQVAVREKRCFFLGNLRHYREW